MSKESSRAAWIGLIFWVFLFCMLLMVIFSEYEPEEKQYVQFPSDEEFEKIEGR